MVNQQSDDLSRVFQALSDPTRRAIIARLARGPETVGAISRPFRMSLPAVSKHLRVLEAANLIRREFKGRERICRLNPPTLAQAYDWLGFYRRFWQERLDALDDLLRESTPDSSTDEGKPATRRREDE